MPLVDYGSTDDEGDEPSQPPKQATQPAAKPAGLFASLPAPKSANSQSGTQSLFAALPPPKSHPTPASSRPDSPRKKIKIYVDVPVPEPEEESPSGNGTVAQPAPTSLFACLPAPKKPAAPAGRIAAPLLPPQVGKKVAAKTSAKPSSPPKLAPPSGEEAEDQIDPDSFFTLSEPTFGGEALDDAGVAAPPLGPSASAQYAYPSASAQYAYNESAQYAYPPQQSYAADDDLYERGVDLSEAALRALGGRETAGIQIKEVSQASLVDTTWQIDPALAAQSSAGGQKPVHISKGAKRKHTIMSLAAEARGRQQELSDATAARMASKAKTRAKYGASGLSRRFHNPPRWSN
ncbi:hypothetical protein BDZ88DRAFT_450048 [Geranomyces variabilis]|nr:hypothetical protein BDZ88DRAFT_450048 [Geranomyces variabilis]